MTNHFHVLQKIKKMEYSNGLQTYQSTCSVPFSTPGACTQLMSENALENIYSAKTLISIVVVCGSYII
jgi:flagellin-specific chaperone FliS